MSHISGNDEDVRFRLRTRRSATLFQIDRLTFIVNYGTKMRTIIEIISEIRSTKPFLAEVPYFFAAL